MSHFESILTTFALATALAYVLPANEDQSKANTLTPPNLKYASITDRLEAVNGESR